MRKAAVVAGEGGSARRAGEADAEDGPSGCEANPGAAEVVGRLVDLLRARPCASRGCALGKDVKVTSRPGSCAELLEVALAHGLPAAERSPDGASSEEATTHMLLYLNRDTFTSETSAMLVDEIEAAREAGVEIVLAHERDPQRNSCEFDEFFRVTPQFLVDGGLYSRIAVTCLPRPELVVSMALLVKALGGEEQSHQILPLPGTPRTPRTPRGQR